MLETFTMYRTKHSFDSSSLKEFPLFAPFAEEQLRGVADMACSILLKAHQVVFRQGEHAEAIYLIIKGGVKLEWEDESGAVYQCCEMKKGQVFGRLSMLHLEPSRVTATATVASELLRIDRALILELIRVASPQQVLDVFAVLDSQARTASEAGFREVLSRQMLALQMEAEKQRAITQMVAGVAHEINTPLSVINTAVSIMARELAAPVEVTIQRAADIAESLQLMRLNVERTDQLVQNFKKISVSQLKDERELFDIAEAIEDTIGLVVVSLKRGRVQVKFHNKLAPDQKKWMGYRGFLSQVVINLLTNVERYAYPKNVGGVVDVTIRMEGDTHYCMCVKDYGGGISEEDQTHIFEPLFTTGKNSGGTGLGLAIVHNLVTNAFKGDVRMKSKVGEGSEFIITFPREISE